MRWCMRHCSKVYAWCMQVPFIWLIFCGQMHEPPKNNLGCNELFIRRYSLNQILSYIAYASSIAACAARKSFSKSARLAMLGKLIANTFQEALILLRLFLDRGLGRSKTLLIFSKFKLIGKLKRNPLNFLVKKTYLQAFLQQLRQQSYYDYQ